MSTGGFESFNDCLNCSNVIRQISDPDLRFQTGSLMGGPT
jgi:hypothetical protein